MPAASPRDPGACVHGQKLVDAIRFSILEKSRMKSSSVVQEVVFFEIQQPKRRSTRLISTSESGEAILSKTTNTLLVVNACTVHHGTVRTVAPNRCEGSRPDVEPHLQAQESTFHFVD